MPVEEKKNIRYFSLKDGTITQTSGDDHEKGRQFSALWGVIVGIELVEDEYEGEKYHKYHFKLEDPNHEQLEILQVGEAASAARGILASLVMIPDQQIRLVHFRPYKNKVKGSDKSYTNVWVQWAKGTGQKWQDVEWDQAVIDGMPAPEELKMSSGKTIYDDGDRRMYVRRIAARVKQRIAGNSEKAAMVDDSTGEVFDGDQAAKNAYGEPSDDHAKKVRQVQTAKLDEHTVPAVDPGIPDIDDEDLPF